MRTGRAAGIPYLRGRSGGIGRRSGAIGWWSGELPGLPPGTRRAREGLRDRNPLAGAWALDGQLEVDAVPALRDQQAEVQGRAADPVGGLGGPPGPGGPG